MAWTKSVLHYIKNNLWVDETEIPEIQSWSGSVTPINGIPIENFGKITLYLL